ncbi:MAG TPA: glycosyltransferase family 4 protein [Pyrinomonadaceae bacterium]|nr:glycosyltransferase family 4 protein [Pyrinomonadaceae bacterium]
MRLLAIVPSAYNTSPGQRFRIEQWEPQLRERGVEVTYQPFESAELNEVLYKPGRVGRKASLVAESFFRRFSIMRSVKNYDVVYVFREAALLGPPIFEHWIHNSGVPMVFDFDDAVFVSYRSPTNGYLSYLKFASKTRTICRMAAHVMAGNRYLADYASRVNQRVTIVPTTIDTDKYELTERTAANGPPTIGWTGSFSTVQHLDTLRPALQKLAKQAKFRLRVIGTPAYDIDGVDVEALPWKAQTEIEDLRDIDIGVMPLPNDDWSKGKCGLKALQFMALGVPTVCSPVGVNTEIIQDGENGFLAGSDDEWIDKLARLLRSPELRGSLGRGGRETVEATYSARVQAPRVYDLLTTVAGAARKR